MQIGDIGYEESETSDMGANEEVDLKSQTPRNHKSSARDPLVSRNINVNIPSGSATKTSDGDKLVSRNLIGQVETKCAAGSSEEDEAESDEVDFRDDQSLSDKLIASTDRLRFSPDASVVSCSIHFEKHFKPTTRCSFHRTRPS